MKKGIFIIIGILLLVIAGYFIFQFSIEKIKNTENNKLINPEFLPPIQEPEGNINQEIPPINSEETSKEPVMQDIEIKGFAFNPETLTIKQGDSVTWTNKDSARHTITSDTGNELDSGLLSKDQAYIHVFNEKGEFSYHCTPHPYMAGKIIVE